VFISLFQVVSVWCWRRAGFGRSSIPLGWNGRVGTNTGGLEGSQPWEVGVEGLYLIVDCLCLYIHTMMMSALFLFTLRFYLGVA
jgi:hypothetical protein